MVRDIGTWGGTEHCGYIHSKEGEMGPLKIISGPTITSIYVLLLTKAFFLKQNRHEASKSYRAPPYYHDLSKYKATSEQLLQSQEFGAR